MCSILFLLEFAATVRRAHWFDCFAQSADVPVDAVGADGWFHDSTHNPLALRIASRFWAGVAFSVRTPRGIQACASSILYLMYSPGGALRISLTSSSPSIIGCNASWES